MPHKLKSFTFLDFVIIASCLAGALLFLPLMQSHAPATVVVYRENKKIAQYALSSPKEITLKGKIGDLSLSIRDNSVRVAWADCPKQICVHAGAIRRVGQQIVCAPNHILIELEASSGKGIDAITQ
ncbi:MAG TPA: NusG domain II-containing protein [Chitinivibrionales bacterium]|nr:NusG domain II-containing protein [Chitinivibrionales bacterium]